jgi:MFS family permease
MPAPRAEGTAARARAALRSRDFRFLLAGRLTGQFGDGVFQAFLIARLVFLNPDEQGTALGVATAYVVLTLPFTVLGPFAGVLIDRWSRRRILMIVPLARAACVVALLPAGEDQWPVLASALVVGSLNRFLLTSATAAMPVLVPVEDLLVSNSMATVGGTVANFVGIVVGTKLTDAIGPGGLLVATAICWPLTTLLFERIRRSLKPVGRQDRLGREIGQVLSDLRAGVGRLWATPPALGAIASATLFQFVIGIVTVLSVVVFKEELKEGVGSYGNLVAAGGAGVLVGTLTVGWFEPRIATSRIVALAFAVAGVTCLATAPWPRGVVILVLSFTLGLAFSWQKVPADTIVQKATPDRYRGRVFALYDLGFGMARVASAAAAVPLIPALSTEALVALFGVAFLAWAPVLPRWIRRRPRARLLFYAGGRAEEVPRAMVIGGEEEPVEVERSWMEERAGRRLRGFRLRTASGSVVDVVRGEDGDTWVVERDAGSEVATPSTSSPPGEG